MITASNIKEIIHSGEGYNLEFKRSVPSKVKEISEEICAFANAAGGIILLGVDDKIFGGALYVQYQLAMQWLKQKISVKYDIEGQGAAARKEIWEVPEVAFKEAIINSLSHRDYYERGAVTTIELFSNRIEISNPGGLISAISKEEFGKKSLSRNPLVFGLFARMQVVEQIGSGIDRMRSLMNEAGLPEPHFSFDGMFCVTLFRPEKTSEKTSEKIIRHIRENKKITIVELAFLTERTTRSIEMQLKKLKDQSKIKRIGSDKGGYWQIIKKQSSNNKD